MIKPKFKVGDKVNLKGRSNHEYNILTITDVDMIGECYTCHQGSVFGFDEQNEWKLVKKHTTKPKDISELLKKLTTEEQEFLWEHVEKVKKLHEEDIMENAIETEVKNGAFYGIRPEICIPVDGYKVGDKVKVIILK